ncbi:hypothetical protein PUNSTDRAFT_47580 [Punctularia strigosozonata HHB-11173 SS5]|uniref:Uncharacterized protein n=1 Tax=Punctularia strigosozonata (strain HHB-11173) TaxID=741275 RepID=R7S3A3_PUNST|nr:uncharacterized protein PUNSTDRAFT_47580 [Punctularia strigosozonata HHB-11173 SS5]EIN04334.1 hypothetical protein PUNSTDRAFT_47580 [Punctularia strigosozonata HHB-11173 SS5]
MSTPATHQVPSASADEIKITLGFHHPRTGRFEQSHIALPRSAGQQNFVPLGPQSHSWADIYPDWHCAPTDWELPSDVVRPSAVRTYGPFNTPVRGSSVVTELNAVDLFTSAAPAKGGFTEIEKLRNRYGLMLQEELWDVFADERVIHRTSFYGVIPYNPNRNLGLCFMLRDPTQLADYPLLASIFDMPVYEQTIAGGVQSFFFSKEKLQQWWYIVDALVRTEASLATHPLATHARLAGVEYEAMARPTDMNMRASFSTRMRARTFAQRAINAFSPMIGEVSYLYAYLRRHLSCEEIREHLLRAGTLTPIWIDLLFTTPVFSLFGPERAGLSLRCRTRDEYLMPLIKTVRAWGLPIQFWWPADERELGGLHTVLGAATPGHNAWSIARRTMDSFAIYRPDVRPEQEGEEGIVSMNTFFRRRDAEDAAELMRANRSSWTPTDEEVITDGPACDVYLWVGDGDYLVRHLVSPTSAPNVLLAYDHRHFRINLRRREIDVYGGWGLPPRSGARRPAASQSAAAGFASYDPDIIDVDYGWDAEGDAMNEPLLLPRNPNRGQPQFGFTSEEVDTFRSAYEEYHDSLVEVVDRPFQDPFSLSFSLGGLLERLRLRYGWKTQAYTYGDTIHWRGDTTNGPLQPYDLDRLLYIYGGSRTAPDGLVLGQDVALVSRLRDYTRYVEIHASVANLPPVVHDWNFEFQSSQIGEVQLTCRTMKLTREFEDNVGVGDAGKVHPPLEALVYVFRLRDQAQEGASSVCLILKSAVSTMQAMRYLRDHPSVEGCDQVTGLARHLLHNGVAFQLAYVREASNNQPETPRQSTRHGLPFRIRETWLGKATAKDFGAWEYIVTEFLKTKRARAALMMGGPVWRIALEYGPAGLLESGVAGPSDDQKAWAAFAVDTDGARYIDDILSPEEQRLVCGSYVVIDSEKGSSGRRVLVSWFPRGNKFWDHGIWTETDEAWFRGHVAGCRSGSKQPLLSDQWRANQRPRNQRGARVFRAFEEIARASLSARLLPRVLSHRGVGHVEGVVAVILCPLLAHGGLRIIIMDLSSANPRPAASKRRKRDRGADDQDVEDIDMDGPGTDTVALRKWQDTWDETLREREIAQVHMVANFDMKAHKKQIDELTNVVAEMSEEPDRKAVEVLSARMLKIDQAQAILKARSREEPPEGRVDERAFEQLQIRLSKEEQDRHRLEEDIATAAAQLEARTAELRLVELQREEASRGIEQYRKDIQSLEGANAQLQLQLTAAQQKRPSRVSERNLSLPAFTLEPTASPSRNPFDEDDDTTSQPALTGAAGLRREMTLEEPEPKQIRRDRAKNERLVEELRAALRESEARYVNLEVECHTAKQQLADMRKVNFGWKPARVQTQLIYIQAVADAVSAAERHAEAHETATAALQEVSAKYEQETQRGVDLRTTCAQLQEDRDEQARSAQESKVETSEEHGHLAEARKDIATLESRLADASVEMNKLRRAAESLNRDCVRLHEQLSEAEKQRNAAIEEVAVTKKNHESVVGQLLASDQELQAVKEQLSAMESRLIETQRVVHREMSDAELQTEYLNDTGLIETQKVDRREMSDAELQTEYSDNTVLLELVLADRERVIAELRHGKEATENKYHALRARQDLITSSEINSRQSRELAEERQARATAQVRCDEQAASLAKLSAEYNALSAGLQSQLKEEEQNRVSALAELHKQELSTLAELHKQELSNMEIEYRSRLERVEQEHKESLEDLRQRAQVAERRCEQLEMEIQTLRESYAADVEVMNAAHERAMMEVVIDHQSEVQGLQDDLATSRAASVVTQRDAEDVERLLGNSRRMDMSELLPTPGIAPIEPDDVHMLQESGTDAISLAEINAQLRSVVENTEQLLNDAHRVQELARENGELTAVHPLKLLRLSHGFKPCLKKVQVLTAIAEEKTRERDTYLQKLNDAEMVVVNTRKSRDRAKEAVTELKHELSNRDRTEQLYVERQEVLDMMERVYDVAQETKEALVGRSPSPPPAIDDESAPVLEITDGVREPSPKTPKTLSDLPIAGVLERVVVRRAPTSGGGAMVLIARSRPKALPRDSSIASPPSGTSAPAEPSSNPPVPPNKSAGEGETAPGKATHQSSATTTPAASARVPVPTDAPSSTIQDPRTSASVQAPVATGAPPSTMQDPSASPGNVQPTSPAAGLEPSAPTTLPRTPRREITPDDVRAMRTQLLLRPSRITEQTRLLRVPVAFVPPTPKSQEKGKQVDRGPPSLPQASSSMDSAHQAQLVDDDDAIDADTESETKSWPMTPAKEKLRQEKQLVSREGRARHARYVLLVVRDRLGIKTDFDLFGVTNISAEQRRQFEESSGEDGGPTPENMIPDLSTMNTLWNKCWLQLMVENARKYFQENGKYTEDIRSEAYWEDIIWSRLSTMQKKWRQRRPRHNPKTGKEETMEEILARLATREDNLMRMRRHTDARTYV